MRERATLRINFETLAGGNGEVKHDWDLAKPQGTTQPNEALLWYVHGGWHRGKEVGEESELEGAEENGSYHHRYT